MTVILTLTLYAVATSDVSLYGGIRGVLERENGEGKSFFSRPRPSNSAGKFIIKACPPRFSYPRQWPSMNDLEVIAREIDVSM